MSVKIPSKTTQLICLLFGHEFNERGSQRNVEFDIVEDEYIKCIRCKAEYHNKSGMAKVFKLKYSKR